MRREQIVGEKASRAGRIGSEVSSPKALAPVSSPLTSYFTSTSLRPFAPGPLRALHRSYGRSDACPPGPSALLRHELRVLHEQVSLIHAPGLPTIPCPTTCGHSASSGHVTHRRVEPRPLPHGSSPNGNSGLRHSLAGSPHRTGRIEFLIVRTGRSPPAAPHPVSPRRTRVGYKLR